MVSLLRVRYKDINLIDYIGTIINRKATGNVIVHWDKGHLLFGGLKTEESMSNLMVFDKLTYNCWSANYEIN
jgi:hypothetical protein